MLVPADAEIYHENSKVDCIYFLQNGCCGNVLNARFRSFKYIDFPERCHFGVVDIFASLTDFPEKEDVKYVCENWIFYKDRLLRHFNVAAQKES